jgi:hypothetical protein
MRVWVVAVIGLSFWGCGRAAEDPAVAVALTVQEAAPHEAPTPILDAHDVVVPRALEAVRADGSTFTPPAPALTGRIAGGAAWWVTVDGDLLVDDGRTARRVDVDVIAELDVDPSGRWLAYAKRPGADAGVFIVDVGDPNRAPRLVTPGLGIADRPRFVDAQRLVVVGAPTGGVAGVWVVRVDRAPTPTPVTNAGLRAGAPLGPTFVPPPAYHESMVVDGGALVYDDGADIRRVSLAEAL